MRSLLIHLCLPITTLIWTDMPKQRVWQEVIKPGKVDLTQRKAVRAGGHIVVEGGGL